MKTLCFANAKGGTGKTTLAVNTAVGLARMNKRVLLVDLDPQGDASDWLLGVERPQNSGSAGVLEEGKIETQHLQEAEPNLLILTGNTRLELVALYLTRQAVGQTVLAKSLKPLQKDFDFCVIDCAPAQDALTINAYCASDGVIAPVLPGFLALKALVRLEETITGLAETFSLKTHLLGFVLFEASLRQGITRESREYLKDFAPDRLFSSEIRESTAAKSLPAMQKTSWDAGCDQRGAKDYAGLRAELLERLGGLQ